MGSGKITALFLLAAFLCWQSTAMGSDRLAEAHSLFKDGHWEKSRQIYREERKGLGAPSSAFFFNHGTSSLKAGANGEAYVLLWKSRLMAPLDKDTANNLKIAQTRLSPATLEVIPATWFSWWPGSARAVAWQHWLLASLLFLAPFLWAKGRNKPSPSWAWPALGLAVALGLAGGLSAWQSRISIGGVLEATKLTSGPGKSYPEISSMEAGSLVNVEELRDGWAKVRFTRSGRQETVGWVEEPAVLQLN